MGQPLSKSSVEYVKEKEKGKMLMSLRPKDGFYFSKAVVEHGKLVDEGYILFIDTDATCWKFVCTRNDTDGFLIKHYKKDEKEGMIIMDLPLLRVFCRQTGHQPPASFYVQPTGQFYKNTTTPIMEILVSKTIQQFQK